MFSLGDVYILYNFLELRHSCEPHDIGCSETSTLKNKEARNYRFSR